MKITWMDKVTNKDTHERTGLSSMEDLLIRKNLRWTGHLMRMSPDRLPKQVLYSQLSSGHRKRGRARRRFKDTNKRNLKLRDVKTDSWTSLSQQRDTWRALGLHSTSVAAPTVWNSLPASVKSQGNIVSFCQHLKTYLLNAAYPP